MRHQGLTGCRSILVYTVIPMRMILTSVVRRIGLVGDRGVGVQSELGDEALVLGGEWVSSRRLIRINRWTSVRHESGAPDLLVTPIMRTAQSLTRQRSK